MSRVCKRASSPAPTSEAANVRVCATGSWCCTPALARGDPCPGDLSSPAPTTARELILAELLMTEMTGVDIFFALRMSHET